MELGCRPQAAQNDRSLSPVALTTSTSVSSSNRVKSWGSQRRGGVFGFAPLSPRYNGTCRAMVPADGTANTIQLRSSSECGLLVSPSACACIWKVRPTTLNLVASGASVPQADCQALSFLTTLILCLASLALSGGTNPLSTMSVRICTMSCALCVPGSWFPMGYLIHLHCSPLWG